MIRPSVLTQMLLLSAFLTLTNSHPHHHTLERYCGVGEGDDLASEFRTTHSYLHTNEPLENSLWNSSLLHAYIHSSSHHARQATNPLYLIDTYFHIVSDPASSLPTSPSYITHSMIAAQFSAIAVAYNNASIGFSFKGATRTTNATWASNGDDLVMKRALRNGTYSSLNVYFQSALQAAPGTLGVPPGSVLLGYCSLPSAGITATTPRDAYVLDGCNVLSSTMPGGGFTDYDEGGSAVHEIGHWNGLLHPFQDNTCSVYDYGDYVADTPQEMSSTTGCPIGKDTCPTSGVSAGYSGAPGTGLTPYSAQGYSGPDPIHNYMDYSTDACYTGFTPGQGARMLNIWKIYREGL